MTPDRGPAGAESSRTFDASAETADAVRAEAEATLAAIIAAPAGEGRRLRELFESRTGYTLGVDQNGRAYAVPFSD